MDLSSFNERAKAAWADCLYLYQDSIYQLNRSIASQNNQLDVQTWLSAAITNEQACQNGFLDFNLPPSLMPFISDSSSSSSSSKLLSNSLAINKAAISSSSSKHERINRRLLAHDFPEWVSARDRKLLQSSVKGDVVVAQDGSGDYKTISEGLAAAASRRSGSKRFVMYVKKGIYKENVEVKRSMKNIMIIGDGIDATIVTASKNVQDGSTTFRSATFAVTGDGFIARGITFENTAGAKKHQAVALRSGSDFSVFYQCSFKGYQDTLYVYSQRQFYRDCDIYGTVDFIFGDAVSVIQNCNIYIRQPMPNQKNTVTAQGRKDPNQNTGIIIHNSHITGATSSKSYLGRPWQKYSRTVFMKCTIDGVIDPAGWLPWSGNFALSTLYYAEYMNTGAGATTGRRVNWPGFHVLTSTAEAGKFSVGTFLAGNSWIPATGVPFTSGL
ncbi:Plant invertase/pectin methylesterase inhibitor superfamily [Perilla frutescens var. hirtella]|uniref:Pectinesterase n=1 Tax=Perilla frutescens var. hirtella TaxID=608512 RepID=A0AAD4J5T7_PERFH|nr:Plant invertase/pectin methylesterase inhibitor superfamily [Perilla frutescens var. hirtella]